MENNNSIVNEIDWINDPILLQHFAESGYSLRDLIFPFLETSGMAVLGVNETPRGKGFRVHSIVENKTMEVIYYSVTKTKVKLTNISETGNTTGGSLECKLTYEGVVTSDSLGSNEKSSPFRGCWLSIAVKVNDKVRN